MARKRYNAKARRKHRRAMERLAMQGLPNGYIVNGNLYRDDPFPCSERVCEKAHIGTYCDAGNTPIEWLRDHRITGRKSDTTRTRRMEWYRKRGINAPLPRRKRASRVAEVTEQVTEVKQESFLYHIVVKANGEFREVNGTFPGAQYAAQYARTLGEIEYIKKID